MTGVKNRRKKEKGEKWKLGLITAGILLAIFLILIVVFQVRDVEVTGNVRFTEEEIKEMIINDTLTSNSLYLTWKYRNSKPDDSMPFFSAVDVVLLSPSSVKIQVYEKTQIGYIQKDDQNVYFDKNGYVLECTDEKRDEVPEIKGIELGTPVPYEKIPIEDEKVFQEVINLAQMLNERNLVPDEIIFDEENNMRLIFGEVIVELGQDEYLEDKITNLAGIDRKSVV